MASEKIVRAIAAEINGVTVFAPEDGRDLPAPINIHPDEDGVQWYWHLTPEDIEAERVASEEAAKAYREANA